MVFNLKITNRLVIYISILSALSVVHVLYNNVLQDDRTQNPGTYSSPEGRSQGIRTNESLSFIWALRESSQVSIFISKSKTSI